MRVIVWSGGPIFQILPFSFPSSSLRPLFLPFAPFPPFLPLLSLIRQGKGRKRKGRKREGKRKDLKNRAPQPNYYQYIICLSHQVHPRHRRRPFWPTVYWWWRSTGRFVRLTVFTVRRSTSFCGFPVPEMLCSPPQ